MKVCFPISIDQGLQSEIYGHFSSAPAFLIVDSETKDAERIENCDPEDPFQGCNPKAALLDKEIEAFVVEGIPDAVLQVWCNLEGHQFFTTTDNSNVEQALEQLQAGKLPKLEPFYSQNEGRCGGDDEGSCDHHDHDDEEEMAGACVNHGGAGCGSHGEGSCTHH